MGYSQEIKNKLFMDFIKAMRWNRAKISQLIIDNYMLFKEPQELEKLIRNDVNRYLISLEMIFPTDLFTKPDKAQGFDPARSEFETAFLFKLIDDFTITMRTQFVIDRPEKKVWLEYYTTGNELQDGEWETIVSDYDNTALTFNQISDIRKEKVEWKKS